MRIAFRAYADDYTVEGSIELQDERLADLLAATDEIAVEDLVVQPSMTVEPWRGVGAIPREELCVVDRNRPSGRPDRRVRTRDRPASEAGPYVIVGISRVCSPRTRSSPRCSRVIALSRRGSSMRGRSSRRKP